MGEPGGVVDEAFRYRIAAQWLGIPYTAIDDTPETILDFAWQEWEALRNADLPIQVKLRGV